MIFRLQNPNLKHKMGTELYVTTEEENSDYYDNISIRISYPRDTKLYKKMCEYGIKISNGIMISGAHIIQSINDVKNESSDGDDEDLNFFRDIFAAMQQNFIGFDLSSNYCLFIH